MSAETLTPYLPLRACPFCGAGTTELVGSGRVWLGMRWSDFSTFVVRHFCEPRDGQPSRLLERVGRDAKTAVDAWNHRSIEELLGDDQVDLLVLVFQQWTAEQLATSEGRSARDRVRELLRAALE